MSLKFTETISILNNNANTISKYKLFEIIEILLFYFKITPMFFRGALRAPNKIVSL